MAWLRGAAGFVRNNIQAFAGVGLAAAVTASMLPQTVLLPHYRHLVAHYKDDQSLPIDADSQQLIDKVLARIELQPDQEARLEFIATFPKDPIHRGSLHVRTGAFIGLPAYFAYKNVSDIEKESILVERNYIDWTSDVGQSLLNSLVLSDKAKGFAIAREVHYVNTYSLQMDVILRTGCSILAYWTGFSLNRKLLLTERLKPWARFGMFSTIAVAWFVMYLAVNDAYYCWRDNSVDRKTARLKKLYAEGGVEYYNKVLQRNQALRTLLKSDGEKQFTKFGNEVTLVRNPHVQLTSRRDNLMRYLKEYVTADKQDESVESEKGKD